MAEPLLPTRTWHGSQPRDFLPSCLTSPAPSSSPEPWSQGQLLGKPRLRHDLRLSCQPSRAAGRLGPVQGRDGCDPAPPDHCWDFTLSQSLGGGRRGWVCRGQDPPLLSTRVSQADSGTAAKTRSPSLIGTPLWVHHGVKSQWLEEENKPIGTHGRAQSLRGQTMLSVPAPGLLLLPTSGHSPSLPSLCLSEKAQHLAEMVPKTRASGANSELGATEEVQWGAGEKPAAPQRERKGACVAGRAGWPLSPHFNPFSFHPKFLQQPLWPMSHRDACWAVPGTACADLIKMLSLPSPTLPPSSCWKCNVMAGAAAATLCSQGKDFGADILELA